MTAVRKQKGFPADYLERVYAGVLGKLIGVYLGRPFEGWTYDKIMRELGEISYYVHDRLGDPLVVTDDDVAGTFTFVRALEDYGPSAKLKSKDIGRAWLNYIVEKRAILWWGGNGNSTEHTAWLNLNNGIPAPRSGAIATNGRTVAEQIGAQIFIDGWALVAPGRPKLAAKLARAAGSVSHDGASVHAAMLWAAMEAEAFVSADVDHLLDTGLTAIPADSPITKLVGDVRTWRDQSDDWRATRSKIAEHYGYDKYCGNCHVMPNHALMLMALLHAPDDFAHGQLIVNTSGWDTDCNAGNLGCLHGIMLGLAGLDAGPDWRGPIADRMLISSADGGNAINDATRTAYYVANLGHALAGADPLPAPKDGAQLHFSLPGSTQGFQADAGTNENCKVRVAGAECEGEPMLGIEFSELAAGAEVVATTPTFATADVVRMRTYELMATPLIYPGQRLRARLVADPGNASALDARLLLRRFGEHDQLVDVIGPAAQLAPGADARLDWVVPDCACQPIGELGVALTAVENAVGGKLFVDWIKWDGAPEFALRRPDVPGDFWYRAWVNGVDEFSKRFADSFRISQGRGRGMIIHGTRQWTDYKVAAGVVSHLGSLAGLAARVQGLRRYYCAQVTRAGKFELVRVRDERTDVLASCPFELSYDQRIAMSLAVVGTKLTATAGSAKLEAVDDSAEAIADGGIGLIVADGAASADVIEVGPAA